MFRKGQKRGKLVLPSWGRRLVWGRQRFREPFGDRRRPGCDLPSHSHSPTLTTTTPFPSLPPLSPLSHNRPPFPRAAVIRVSYNIIVAQDIPSPALFLLLLQRLSSTSTAGCLYLLLHPSSAGAAAAEGGSSAGQRGEMSAP